VEDADGDFVPGVFSFCENPVCGAFWRLRSGVDLFTGIVLRGGWTGAVREGVCRDWGGVGGARENQKNKHSVLS